MFSDTDTPPAVVHDPGYPLIELDLREIAQLFNSMDPSPFHEKDLDHDAEEFIVSWAEEYPAEQPLRLRIHLETLPEVHGGHDFIGDGIRHYFAYRAKINRLEFKRLMKQGRVSLLIGSLFLGACLGVAELTSLSSSGAWGKIVRESLTICGWVAMWRPIQIYLYDWWPLKRRGKTYDRLSRVPVEVALRTRTPERGKTGGR